MQYDKTYQRRGIGCLPRTVMLLLLAAALFTFIYRRLNTDHQYENVAIFPALNITSKTFKKPQTVINHKKINATNHPVTPTMRKFSISGNEVRK